MHGLEIWVNKRDHFVRVVCGIIEFPWAQTAQKTVWHILNKSWRLPAMRAFATFWCCRNQNSKGSPSSGHFRNVHNVKCRLTFKNHACGICNSEQLGGPEWQAVSRIDHLVWVKCCCLFGAFPREQQNEGCCRSCCSPIHFTNCMVG